jgi:hypothetical protein
MRTPEGEGDPIVLKDNPRAGDVVISKHESAESSYVLATFQGQSQLTYRSFDDALQHATKFAVKKRVDVWNCEDGVSHRLLVRQRRSEVI